MKPIYTITAIVFILLNSFSHIVHAETIQLSTNAITKPTIVLNSAAAPPYTTEANDGFLNELASMLFRQLGYQLIVENIPAERALYSANSGLIDGEITRVGDLSQYYPNLIQMPVKMMIMNFVAFSKIVLDSQSGWQALANKEVGFITGWKIYEREVPKTAFITRTSNAFELFTLIKKNRIDLVLYSRWPGRYLIDKLQLKNIKLREYRLVKKDMFMYLHQKHRALVPKIASALAAMKKDGRYTRLVKKHLNPLE